MCGEQLLPKAYLLVRMPPHRVGLISQNILQYLLMTMLQHLYQTEVIRENITLMITHGVYMQTKVLH